MDKRLIEFTFGECEHEGDLDHYIDGMISHGAKIKSAFMPCPEYAEVGIVKAEVTNEQLQAIYKDPEVGGFLDGTKVASC